MVLLLFILNACESNVEIDTRLNGYISIFSGIYDFTTILVGGGPTEKYVPCFQRYVQHLIFRPCLQYTTFVAVGFLKTVLKFIGQLF